MLTLLTFKPCLGVRSPSPFAVKAEALLAMSGLEYTLEYGDIRKSPTGKFPILKDGEKLIPDTAHIQSYLESEKGVDFDNHLSPEETAVATAFRRLIEHHFYFINMHFRWTEHGDAVRDNFFADAPGFLRNFIFKMVRKNLIKTIHLQGLGRHSRDELIAFAKTDIKAIASQLGNKKYLFGNQASSIDASLYGALTNLVDIEMDTPMKSECLKHDNLVAYCARFKKEIFND